MHRCLHALTKDLARSALLDMQWKIDFLIFFTAHPPPERALCLPKEPFAPSWIILEGILGSTDFDF